MAKVSIVIPSWDGAEILERTLPSVLSQRGISYEVIIVSHGSTKTDTKELITRLDRKYPDKLRLISLEKQAGYTGAVNTGVAAAKTALVVVLGNDNIVEPTWLASLVNLYGTGRFKKTGRSIGAVMSQTIVSKRLLPGPCTLNFFGRNIFYADPHWAENTTVTFYPGGNAFLFDKEQLGLPFEDFYFTYHEDVSLGWRLQNHNLEVIQAHYPYVQSFDGGTTKRKSVRYGTQFYTERNRWLNLLTFPEWHTILRLSPLWLLDSIFSLLLGGHRMAKLHAWLWILSHPRRVFPLRYKRQRERTVPDRIALKLMSPLYFSTVPAAFGWKKQFHALANLLVFLYLRILLLA